MAFVIVLDTSPLFLASGPRGKGEVQRCLAWIKAFQWAGALIIVPEIADFEFRRELLRALPEKARAGGRRLDLLIGDLIYSPITRPAMRRAAEYSRHVRKAGQPTADDRSLDADCIVAAQAVQACGPDDVMTIATAKVRHLSRLPGIDARPWESIT